MLKYLFVMSDLNIVSYNVRGLGHPIKRKKIFAQLKSLKSSIALLQETHLNDLEHKKLKREWVDQVCPKSRGRGVAILLSRTTYFSVQKEVKDMQGRYVMVVGSVKVMDITIMNIYAPNEEDPNFFIEVASVLAKDSKGVIILAGDFNCVLDPKQDKLPPEQGRLGKKTKVLKYLLEELGMIDSWRAYNPQGRDFTFFSNVHGSYSRLDILISKRDLHRVVQSGIEPITLSDHGPARITLRVKKEKYFKYWRLNVSMLNDPRVQEQTKTTIDEYFRLNDNGAVSQAILWDGAKAVIRGKCIELASIPC